MKAVAISTGCAAMMNTGDSLPIQRLSFAHDRVFLGTTALLLVASASCTIYWCGSLSDDMSMAYGRTMSMAFMRMPEQTWLGVATSFLGMWTVMMVAMMLPSLTLMLSTYRRSIRALGEIRVGRFTALAGAGYFFVWGILGVGVYAIGISLATAEVRWPMLARSVPIAAGALLLLAGFIQLTAWKIRLLASCRKSACAGALPEWNAWRHGRRLGVRCALCCSSLMIVLLVLGVMNLTAMAIVTAAITIERFTPRPERAVRITGVIVVAAAAIIIVRTLGIG